MKVALEFGVQSEEKDTCEKRKAPHKSDAEKNAQPEIAKDFK
jgi:hypothetical protein